jgi:hypothetical protein
MPNMMFKRVITLCLFLSLSLSFITKADEGMWLPLLLKELNEQDMKDRGLKLSADDIYNVNRSSLKDAIVSFGGFCTGEVISSQGLVLTNHHCGYGQVQSHSSVENDLLTKGFWAMDKNEELPNPGLFVTFIVRMEDVTQQVLEGINHSTDEISRESLVKQRIAKITRDAVSGTHYKAYIKPFFYGNEYYLFVTETFNDIRLVGSPPSSIGKFGGDTDNWMWTRHTGDFALFRIYSGPDGKPANYSKDNIPYVPKHHLPISLNGVQQGDFTMVFGFPGRTTQYLSSYAIKLIVEETNPHRIQIRERKLDILNKAMKADDAIRIKYAAKYASTANGWKKWIGENKGLKRLNAIALKENQEQKFNSWANENHERKQKYGHVIPELKQAYKEQAKVNLANTYITEAAYGAELIRIARAFSLLKKEQMTQDELEIVRSQLSEIIPTFYKDYDHQTDAKVFAALMQMYHQQVPAQYQPTALKNAAKKYKGNFSKYARKVYDQTIFRSQESVLAFLDNFNHKSVKKLEKDPGFKLMEEVFKIYLEEVQPAMSITDAEIEKLSRLYTEGLRLMQPDKKFYPDANSTMRVAFGQIDTYEPKDGVKYKYYTTLDGIIEKENPDSDEFIVPAKLKELYLNKDYGIYGKDGKMPVCFIASNHTTGGNSGSPIINAKGHLIGTNFDRNWEGTMSDIMYDPKMCRNIAVDIRYTLFIIDKFAGAGHLVEEMTLVGAEELVATP